MVAELSALHVAGGDAGFVADDVRDFKPFGLDPPAMTIEMTPAVKGGKPQVLRVGSAAPGDEGRLYARRGDEDDVILIEGRGIQDLGTKPNALRSQNVADIVPDRVELPGDRGACPELHAGEGPVRLGGRRPRAREGRHPDRAGPPVGAGRPPGQRVLRGEGRPRLRGRVAGDGPQGLAGRPRRQGPGVLRGPPEGGPAARPATRRPRRREEDDLGPRRGRPHHPGAARHLPRRPAEEPLRVPRTDRPGPRPRPRRAAVSSTGRTAPGWSWSPRRRRPGRTTGGWPGRSRRRPTTRP